MVWTSIGVSIALFSYNQCNTSFITLEYPASRGGKPEDKNNLVSLLRELKEAFIPKGYLLTSAVSAGKWNIEPAYDIPAVSQ